MEFFFHRSYRGPLKAVILDWAGTTMDFGCLAPAVVFMEIYKRFGVEITMAQAREQAHAGLHANGSGSRSLRRGRHCRRAAAHRRYQSPLGPGRAAVEGYRVQGTGFRVSSMRCRKATACS